MLNKECSQSNNLFNGPWGLGWNKAEQDPIDWIQESEVLTSASEPPCAAENIKDNQSPKKITLPGKLKSSDGFIVTW